MPGIGVRTGAGIVIDIGDGRAFATAGRLAAHAGLAGHEALGSSLMQTRP